MEFKYCSYANKRCYTERKANEALRLSKKHSRKDIPKAKYYCKECGYWHLTSHHITASNAQRKKPLKEIYK